MVKDNTLYKRWVVTDSLYFNNPVKIFGGTLEKNENKGE
jgi:hypothetical protein